MSPTEPAPHIVIKPPSRWAPLNLGEVWEFRDLLTRFAIRDLKLRYKQTALGVIWVVLQPLLAAGIFTFVFGRVAGLPSEGVPYFVFAYVGMMAWTAFSSTLSKISGSLVGNAQLISKIFFPRLVLPLSTLGSTLVDFSVALAMGVVVIAVGGVTPSLAILTMPLWFVLALALGSGLGLIAAALMVQYRDIAYVLPVVTQFLLYGTPIAYALSAVPESSRWIVELNPLTGVIEGFRWSLIDTPAPPPAVAAWSLIASVMLFLAGSLVFTRMERRFADVI
jgi:lipopolysaccharide transport system permease protein